MEAGRHSEVLKPAARANAPAAFATAASPVSRPQSFPLAEKLENHPPGPRGASPCRSHLLGAEPQAGPSLKAAPLAGLASVSPATAKDAMPPEEWSLKAFAALARSFFADLLSFRGKSSVHRAPFGAPSLGRAQPEGWGL